MISIQDYLPSKPRSDREEYLKGMQQTRERMGNRKKFGIPDSQIVGLCGMLFSTVSWITRARLDPVTFIADMAEFWAGYSGSPTYPVPHPTMEPCEAYNLNPGYQKWDPETPYGQARRELLDWLIEQIELSLEVQP